jgi:UDP-glucose 4-epimerase
MTILQQQLESGRMMTAKIVVTGGCGFIGSNLLPLLAARGLDAYAFDNLSRGRATAEIRKLAQVVEGDIRDADALERVLSGAAAVVHLAAYGSVVESVADPLPNFDINARGTLNVLEASRKAGVRRVIFASTGGAIIGNATPPVNELSLPKPISPYGASKLCGEAYCHAYASAYAMETVCLRFANVYGPKSLHKRSAVNSFIKALLKGQPLVIYGDGSASRDFLHVDDLCAGINAALDHALAPGEVIHLASERETTVGSLAMQIAAAGGFADPAIDYRPARAGEIARNFATSDKARRMLGFAPRVALPDGLERTWDWFRSLKQSDFAVAESDS